MIEILINIAIYYVLANAVVTAVLFIADNPFNHYQFRVSVLLTIKMLLAAIPLLLIAVYYRVVAFLRKSKTRA